MAVKYGGPEGYERNTVIIMSKICHFQINVSDLKQSADFYDAFLKEMGWKKEMEDKDMIGYTDGTMQLFISQTEKNFRTFKFHRKQTGLNHFAFWVDSREAVDKFHKFLEENSAVVLYGGPREYPEYGEGYYAVFFEDPDRIKLEVCHCPLD